MIAERRGDLEAAERSYSAALARLPQYAQARGHLAGVVALEGRPAEAEDLLKPLAASDDPEYEGQLSRIARDPALREHAARRYDVLLAEFPEAFRPGGSLSILGIAHGTAQLRYAFRPRSLRPGGTLSGTTMMILADAAMYVAGVPTSRVKWGKTATNHHTSKRRRPGNEIRMLKLLSFTLNLNDCTYARPRGDMYRLSAVVLGKNCCPFLNLRHECSSMDLTCSRARLRSNNT